MKKFDKDDKGYLNWIEKNSKGYALNVLKKPNLKYLVIHRAKCRTISTNKRTNWTTKGNRKICSMSKTELDEWCQKEVGGIPKYCKLCKPANNLG